MKSKLSQRLNLAFEMAIPGKDLWDICCDHGLLGARAVQSQLFPQVHFVDQVPEIMKELESKVMKNLGRLNLKEDSGKDDWRQKIKFYTKAAERLSCPLSGNVFVLGVGAEKINFFLQHWQQNKILQAERLILGPHKDVEWFQQEIIPHLKNYQLTNELEVLERDKKRKLFVLSRVIHGSLAES